MIIVGYQGIGKSSLAGAKNGYIDLESSNFWINGNRLEDWYKVYGNIALDLSRQGFNVFTPSHAVLRKYLFSHNYTDELIYVCHPSIRLKDQWIKKLKDRYTKDRTDKNFKAWKNAEDRYEDNIKEIIDDAINFNWERILIDDMNYNLSDLIKLSIGTDHLY